MKSFNCLAALNLLLPLFVFANSSKKDSQNGYELPKPEVRKVMVLELAKQVGRIDGEGLLPRENRPESWGKTVEKLSVEAVEAQTLYDLGRVFKRFNASYPNLHANVYMIPELDEKKAIGTLKFPFKFSPVRVDRQYKISNFRIVVSKSSKTDLKNGDELVSINSRPLQKWTDENFIFCKFPYREQCEIEFFDNFRNELLSWNRHQSLELTVHRNGKELKFAVTPEVRSDQPDDETDSQRPCGISPLRYKGFSLVYEGQNLCAFESQKDNRIVALRMKSFVYQEVPFAVLDGEVQIFWNNYWKKKSSSVKSLILDVIDNYGGQSPVPYFALFYSQPYQELYVQFKKIDEFEQKEILESLFWGDKGKEIWFENIKKDGSFAQTENGGFLPPIPQFCAEPNKDCREGLFKPRKNNFTGQVKVLMNHWCISSCVGFVSNIKALLKNRVQTFGIPDSGDSAYSRLAVFVSPLSNGEIESKVAPMKKARTPDKPEPWVRQVAAVTRSTNKNGNVLSGKPQYIDVWVPRKWNQTDDEWAASVFDRATGQ